MEDCITYNCKINFQRHSTLYTYHIDVIYQNYGTELKLTITVSVKSYKNVSPVSHKHYLSQLPGRYPSFPSAELINALTQIVAGTVAGRNVLARKLADKLR